MGLPPPTRFGLQNKSPAKHPESLSGLIERIKYFNEDSGDVKTDSAGGGTGAAAVAVSAADFGL
jgi:hypothetical protein